MAGVDNTLLALAGAGFPTRRSFGFASCERVVGAAEGMNVLAQERVPAEPVGGTDGSTREFQYSYRVTNVEYTEFERLGEWQDGVGVLWWCCGGAVVVM
jgi:hypothetical protein